MKRKPSGPSPVDFYEEEVLPAVFAAVDTIFPAFAWKRTARGWTATAETATRALPGAPRPDRVVCNRPGGFLIHGGEAVSWLAYLGHGSTPRGADFVEAVKELALKAGVDPSPIERTWTPEEAARLEARERRRALLEDFAALAHAELLGPAGEAARGYLVGRGYREEELGSLALGLCAPLESLARAMKAKGHTEAELGASGILADRRWAGRLLIPWRDARGHIATLAARDLTGTAEEKYVYLKGGPKPPAFGLDVAAARQEGLVLVEGILDVVLLQARGMDYVAALGGAGGLLTPERWRALIGMGLRSFTLALDSDPPGREGTLKALVNLRNVANAPNVYVVPPETLGTAKDPDELVRTQGLKAFRAALGQARAWVPYLGETFLEGVTPASGDRERREAVDRVLDLTSGLRDERALLDAEDLLRLTAERSGYSPEALLEMDKAARERHARELAGAEVGAALHEGQEALRKPGADPFGVAADLTARLTAARGRAEDPPPAFCVDALLEELKRTPEGLTSGWDAVDRLGIRFQAKELALLAARTGHGKTSALVNLIRTWLDAGTVGELILFSHEEPVEVVLCRLASLLTADADREEDRWRFSEVRDFLRDPLSRRDWPRPTALEDTLGRLREAEGRLHIVHRPGWGVEPICTHTRERAEAHPVAAVLVDYLQRIPPPAGRRMDRRDQEVSAIGRALKTLAVDLGVPVVAAAQINREAIPQKYQEGIRDALDKGGIAKAEAYMRAARPDLHNLREGGAEQEADLVLGLMSYAADLRQESEADSLAERSLFEVGALKNRYGLVGRWAALEFEGPFGLIRDRRGC